MSNRCYSDSRVEHVKRHFSNAETIQAIGRARLIHGKPKDVYLFSNESLGADITIADFFRYEEPKYADAIQNLKRIGYCRVKKSDLIGLGLTENALRSKNSAIEGEFFAAGIEKVAVTVRDSHYNIRKREFYVFDRRKLSSHFDDSELVEID